MASLHMMKPSFSAFPTLRFRELNCFAFWVFDFEGQGKGVFRVPRQKGRSGVGKIHRVCCKFQDGASQSNSSDEPPESLFMKELRRRGIAPTSLLDGTDRSTRDEEKKEPVGDRSISERDAIESGFSKNLTIQREQSMALNSEALEGLIPRAKLLLRIGGTFFLSFGPLILITVASFAAFYLYFGPTFIHDASKTPFVPPQYTDPYVLQEERIA